jgi:tetratricopeptide (TPR) repeat protein
VLLALAGVGLSAAVLRARQAAFPAPPSTERLLYLRSGSVADRLALSFDAVVADVYWIRAIQHYGRDLRSDRGADRFEILQPLLDLTTTLDTRFNIAYRFGAVFLSSDPPKGPGRPDQAIALLEKGLRHNPGRWQYQFDIAFVHYFATQNFAAAADAFDRAAAMPGAPEWLRPVAAKTRLQGGDRASARRMFSDLLRSEEAYIRDAARRGLDQIAALDMIDAIQKAIEDYYAKTGTYPQSLTDLERAGYPRVPADPTGVPFEYHADKHSVTLSGKSSLHPLPTSLK